MSEVFENFFRLFGPSKSVFLQSLVPKTKAVSVPVKYLDDIAPTIAEGKKMTARGIHL